VPHRGRRGTPAAGSGGFARCALVSDLTSRPHAASDDPVSRVVRSPGASAPEPDDGGLVGRAAAGDADARERLVRLYLSDVYAATSRVLSDRQLAEDAAQDAFMNALNNLHRFRGDASFRTWLLRIAVNAAHSVGRRQGRRREVGLAVVADVPDHGIDAETRAVARAESRQLDRTLERLPPKQRLAVTLRAQQGLSYQEIARTMGCTEGAARVNYHLGVKRLKELMS
jgi:RNA polymerase sigma-70 factor, ECF subfamily